MSRIATHKQIVQLHESIVQYHKGLNGFCRFNWDELASSFRSGVETPALLLESHSSELETNPNGSTSFNSRAISFMILDFAPADDYDKQEEILDLTENICIDIISFLVQESKKQGSWFYGLFDIKSVKIEKVGPLWDSMYGWNVLYTIKNREPMALDPEQWDFTT